MPDVAWITHTVSNHIVEVEQAMFLIFRKYNSVIDHARVSLSRITEPEGCTDKSEQPYW